MKIEDLPIKFFPSDVIGRKPKKVGDTFKAKFFGGRQRFKVIEYDEHMYFAVIARSSGSNWIARLFRKIFGLGKSTAA
jgi:hypothetical protein